MVTADPIIPEVLANRYCSGCILIKRSNLILLRNRALNLKMQYVPHEIETLLLAESPPTKFQVQPERYFYAPGKIRYGTLFYYTMYVLFEKEMNGYKIYNKEYFLDRFKDKGFYLIDMAKCPIDKLPNDEKTKAIESCAQYLQRELNALSFWRIVVIGKSSFRISRRKLDLDFDPVVIPLPFGSQRNVEGYMTGLKRHLYS